MKKLALVFSLAVFDQAAKLIIQLRYSNSFFEIIAGFLNFAPVHNRDMSWLGSMGVQLFSNFYFTVFMNLVLLAVTSVLYRYVCVFTKFDGILTHSIFILLLSGIICSTMDRAFWKGSLDYLQFVGFFTFDLKDCYLTGFEILLVYSCIRYRDLWKNFNIKRFLKGFYTSME